MTTNQAIDGVPRKLRPLLAMILNALDRDAEDGKAACGEMASELRALLDEPAAPVVPCAIADALESAQWPNTSIGNKVLVAAAITELRKAAQPQGEPVAWRFRWDYEHGNGWQRNAVRFVESLEHVDHEDKSTWRDITPLYAEQPAPVAVVKLGTHHVLGAIHNVEGFPGVTGFQIKTLTDLLNSVITGK